MSLTTENQRDVRELPDGVSYEPGDVKTVHHAKVYDAPDMQDPHRKRRDVMRPRRVEIAVLNGVVIHVSVLGPSVRLNGSTGTKRLLRWFGRNPDPTNPEPAWLIGLVTDQALHWPGRVGMASVLLSAFSGSRRQAGPSAAGVGAEGAVMNGTGTR